MRISTGLQFERFSAGISNAQSKLSEAQLRAITGKKFQRASEDPVGAGQILRMSSLKNRIESLGRNVLHGKERISVAENSLSDMTDLLNSAKTLAIQAASDALPTESKASLASQISDLQTRLVSLGNAQDSSGQYVFAGQNSGEKPYVKTADGIEFKGDALPVRGEIGPGESMDFTIVDSRGVVDDLYAELESLKAAVQGGDVQAISDTHLSKIDEIGAQILRARGEAGAKLQSLEKWGQNHADQMDSLTARISDVGEADMAQTLTELQQAQLAYSASLQTASSGMNLSLLNFMR